MRRRFLSVVGACGALTGLLTISTGWKPAAAAASPTSSTTQAVTAEANWLLAAQMPDGGLAVWPDTPTLRLIWPYLANYGAIGLARAAQTTGNLVYAQHAWQWLAWYGAHEQAGTGYVTDYNIDNGTTAVSNGNIDSTDAYAGTFLAAAWDTWVADPQASALTALEPAIQGALGAIESTQDSDGLTWAKPSWHVKYLMDNVEAYGGLEGATNLARALGDSALTARATSDAQRMAAGIASLWDPATGGYDWARHGDGVSVPVDWSNLYPDTMEEAYAVAWGAVPYSRSSSIVSELTLHHPQWDQPDATDTYLTNSTAASQAVGYWPLAATALATGGDAAGVPPALSSITTAATAKGWGWPWTTADEGQLIVAQTGGSYVDPASAAVSTGSTSGHPTGGVTNHLTTSSPTSKSVHATGASAPKGPPALKKAGTAFSTPLVRTPAFRAVTRHAASTRTPVTGHRVTTRTVADTSPARGRGPLSPAGLLSEILAVLALAGRFLLR